jgi:hypothetical protein
VFLFKSKESKTRDFENLRVAIFREKEILDGQVERGELGEVEFANKVNDRVGRYMESASKMLSPEDFQDYFGEPYQIGTKPTLVDPHIAALNRR